MNTIKNNKKYKQGIDRLCNDILIHIYGTSVLQAYLYFDITSVIFQWLI